LAHALTALIIGGSTRSQSSVIAGRSMIER
jgi:hypothetical protein